MAAATRGGPDWLKRWGWRAWWVVGIAAALVIAFRAFAAIKLAAIPLVLSVFPAAVLWPLRSRLRRRGLGRGLAALTVLLPAVALVGLTGWVLVAGLSESFSGLAGDLSGALGELRSWLVEGPLGIPAEQIDRIWSQSSSNAAESALGGLLTGLEIAAGALLTIVFAFFILKDGDRLARTAGRPWGKEARALEVGRLTQATLARYLGGLAAVGVFDAVLIGIGLVVIGVPYILPLVVLIFWGSFFPIVGAWTTGLAGVVVALVNGGVADALWTVALITLVQQIEGNVVMPVLVGGVVSLHPMLVLLAVIGGGAAFGVAGAFLAVPALAVTNRIIGERRGVEPLSVGS